MAGRILFVTRFQSLHLDRSLKYLRKAELLYANRRSEEAKGALYSAVDTNQGNWEAMLRWGLSILEGSNNIMESNSAGNNESSL